jgi:asparagine synthase (glutamine-hydrolysing)
MLAYQEIYGPHDGRLWSEGPLAMGRRLFRTLPEDVSDRQPVRTPDGGLILVADVRLDNRTDLVRELELPPDRASRWCDADILLECLARWSEGALTRIVGDFAFALWDIPRRTLLLARDFLGQRPIHYHRGKDFFAFASMPKGLHALSEIPFGPDEQMMAEFVTLMPHDESRTFFKEINLVEPGSYLTITRERISAQRYWEPRPSGPFRMRADEYVDGLRHHLDRATQSRLRGANGAVASHLSSGFDSGSVTATAARLMAPGGGKIVAFTAVPREGYEGQCPQNRLGDEGPLAAATAAMYPNIEHVLLHTGHLSPLDELERNFFLFDGPILNLCNWVWARAINRAAQERELNVMLVGQMGNMTISYGGLELLPELLLAGRLIKFWRAASKLVADGGCRWRGAAAYALGPFMPAWLWGWLNERYHGEKWEILDYTAIRADRLAALDLFALARERGLDFSYRPWKNGFAMRLWVLRRVDLGNYNKGTLAGWGIDQRDPTADKRVVEYCLSIPTEQYLAGGVPRSLAKRAFADRLPQAVLNAPKRGYQALDWHEGLTAARSELAAELAQLAACSSAAGILDTVRLKRLFDNWPTTDWHRFDIVNSYRLALLRGVSAGDFLLRASSGENR